MEHCLRDSVPYVEQIRLPQIASENLRESGCADDHRASPLHAAARIAKSLLLLVFVRFTRMNWTLMNLKRPSAPRHLQVCWEDCDHRWRGTRPPAAKDWSSIPRQAKRRGGWAREAPCSVAMGNLEHLETGFGGRSSRYCWGRRRNLAGRAIRRFDRLVRLPVHRCVVSPARRSRDRGRGPC